MKSTRGPRGLAHSKNFALSRQRPGVRLSSATLDSLGSGREKDFKRFQLVRLFDDKKMKKRQGTGALQKLRWAADAAVQKEDRMVSHPVFVKQL